MAGVDVPGQAGEHAPGVGLPVRREQAAERRHDVQPAVVLDRLRQLLHLGRRLDQLEVVAQPLDERPGDRDRPLQAVDRVVVADLVPDGRQQARLGVHELGAGVDQHEVAGAVRVLGLPDVEAGLAERGRLLVAEVAGQGHARKRAGLHVAVDLAGGADLRQHRRRHADRRGDLLVPGQRAEVHQHRAAGIGHIGDVQAAVGAARQVPDQPRVHVPEHEIAGLGLFPRAVHVVEDPADLRPGEVGRQRQADLLPEAILASVG